MRPLMRNLVRLRIHISVASTNSTKMSKLSNSYGSSQQGPDSRKPSVAGPGGVTPMNFAGNNNVAWPGYAPNLQEYKATLDRDLDPVGYQHQQSSRMDEPRLHSIAVPSGPDHGMGSGAWQEPHLGPMSGSSQRLHRGADTGVTSEVTLGGLDRDSADSDDRDDDDDIRHPRGRHAKKKGSHDLEKGLPMNGIKVEKAMKWSEEEREAR